MSDFIDHLGLAVLSMKALYGVLTSLYCFCSALMESLLRKNVHFGQAGQKLASCWALFLSDCSFWHSLFCSHQCSLKSVSKWEGDIVYYHAVMTNKNIKEKTDPQKVPRKICSDF